MKNMHKVSQDSEYTENIVNKHIKFEQLRLHTSRNIAMPLETTILSNIPEPDKTDKTL